MRDELGLYYYARPGNTDVKVYVRRGDDGRVQFRLWVRDHPEVWDGHEWVPHDALLRAADLYRKERNPNASPMSLYDIDVARALLKEDKP